MALCKVQSFVPSRKTSPFNGDPRQREAKAMFTQIHAKSKWRDTDHELIQSWPSLFLSDKEANTDSESEREKSGARVYVCACGNRGWGCAAWREGGATRQWQQQRFWASFNEVPKAQPPLVFTIASEQCLHW
jgi:hypothetical protein